MSARPGLCRIRNQHLHRHFIVGLIDTKPQMTRIVFHELGIDLDRDSEIAIVSTDEICDRRWLRLGALSAAEGNLCRRIFRWSHVHPGEHLRLIGPGRVL